MFDSHLFFDFASQLFSGNDNSSILRKCVRTSIYSKLCDWHYIYPVTVFLNCALIIISHNSKIITP